MNVVDNPHRVKRFSSLTIVNHENCMTEIPLSGAENILTDRSHSGDNDKLAAKLIYRRNTSKYVHKSTMSPPLKGDINKSCNEF
jgi:hypothetical protein